MPGDGRTHHSAEGTAVHYSFQLLRCGDASLSNEWRMKLRHNLFYERNIGKLNLKVLGSAS